MGRKHKDDSHARSMPSEEEIERICREEIRPLWSEREEKKRTRVDDRPTRWKLQVVKVNNLPPALQKMIESVNKDQDDDPRREVAKERKP